MRLAIVDSLKGVAILCVLVQHFLRDISVNFPEIIMATVALCGVPLFVLLMAFNFGNSWNKNGQLKPYFVRRAKRLIPTLVVVFAASAILSFTLGITLKIAQTSFDGIYFSAGAGSYFIAIIFQFVVLAPLLYLLFKKSHLFSGIAFIGINAGFYVFRIVPLIALTYYFIILRFLVVVWIGFMLTTKLDAIKRFDFSLPPLERLGMASYQIFLVQMLFFSQIGIVLAINPVLKVLFSIAIGYTMFEAVEVNK